MRTFVLALALVGLVGCGGKPASVPAVAKKAPRQVMTREEFEEKMKGLVSAQDFINQFGTPTKTEQRGEEFILYYAKITRDTITGKVDDRVFVVFTGVGVDAKYDRHRIIS